MKLHTNQLSQKRIKPLATILVLSASFFACVGCEPSGAPSAKPSSTNATFSPEAQAKIDEFRRAKSEIEADQIKRAEVVKKLEARVQQYRDEVEQLETTRNLLGEAAIGSFPVEVEGRTYNDDKEVRLELARVFKTLEQTRDTLVRCVGFLEEQRNQDADAKILLSQYAAALDALEGVGSLAKIDRDPGANPLDEVDGILAPSESILSIEEIEKRQRKYEENQRVLAEVEEFIQTIIAPESDEFDANLKPVDDAENADESAAQSVVKTDAASDDDNLAEPLAEPTEEEWNDVSDVVRGLFERAEKAKLDAE